MIGVQLRMTILPAETGSRGDPFRLRRRWGVIFGDENGDEDKILFSKVGGAGMGKYSPPRF